MAQAKIFGNLRYNEQEHGWALEVGLFLGNWIISYGDSRSVNPTLGLKYRNHALMCRSVMLQRLEAYRINVEIFTYNDYFNISARATIDIIVEKIRITHSPEHCAFALIGLAGCFFEWLNYLSDQNDILEIERRLKTAIGKL